MDIAVWSGHGSFHPFQAAQTRGDGVFLVTGFGGFYSQIVFAQQIDGAGSPCMAEAFAVWTSVHGQMPGTCFFGIVFLPETGSSFFQHTAPIGFHFFHHRFLFAQGAQCFQFIETHIRSGDFQNTVILQYGVFDGLLFIGIQIIEEDREHIGVTGNGLTLLALNAVVYHRLFLLIPESGFQLGT